MTDNLEHSTIPFNGDMTCMLSCCWSWDPKRLLGITGVVMETGDDVSLPSEKTPPALSLGNWKRTDLALGCGGALRGATFSFSARRSESSGVPEHCARDRRAIDASA